MTFAFGDMVEFTHQYTRLVGGNIALPRGEHHRLLGAPFGGMRLKDFDLHPDSKMDPECVYPEVRQPWDGRGYMPTADQPTRWVRIKVWTADGGPMRGVYANWCYKQEGIMGGERGYDGEGRSWKPMGAVKLAEVMVAPGYSGPGSLRFAVVHPDDLTLVAR